MMGALLLCKNRTALTIIERPLLPGTMTASPLCVMMLSDCAGMVGGETALRTPKGDVSRSADQQWYVSGHHALEIEGAGLVNYSNRELL